MQHIPTPVYNCTLYECTYNVHGDEYIYDDKQQSSASATWLRDAQLCLEWIHINIVLV